MKYIVKTIEAQELQEDDLIEYDEHLVYIRKINKHKAVEVELEFPNGVLKEDLYELDEPVNLVIW
jgi:hypothetical protein